MLRMMDKKIFTILRYFFCCLSNPIENTASAANSGLTHLSLGSFYRTLAISAEPDQTPQNAASDQVLHCLLIELNEIET